MTFRARFASLSRPAVLRLAVGLLCAALILWFGGRAVDVSLHKSYSLDEFQYAHGAWLISEGEVPYRDFFEHHFPLVHQVMAGVFRLVDDDPGNILVLRAAMLPFLLLTLIAGLAVNRRFGPITGWITPLVLLSTSQFVAFATEIRPDPIAFALFLAALAVVGSRRLGPRLRGAVGGVLLTAAVWGSQKVFYYGLIFPAAWVVDLVRGRKRPGWVGNPVAFAGGSAVVLAVLAGYFAVTGSFQDWVHWCLEWSFVHQVHYPRQLWTSNFLGFLSFHGGLVPFVVVGVVATVRRLRRASEPGTASSDAADPDVLLLAALATTFASFIWQAGPYLYSLLPFMGMAGLFAARGVTASFAYLAAARKHREAAATFGLAALSLLLAGELLHARTEYARLALIDNAGQHRLLATLGTLTEPGDPVYDLAGRQVTRPSVHYFYFTDAVVRRLLAERLAREIPRAILDTGCTVFFYARDDRLRDLPPELQAFLLGHFVPYDEDLWLWGQRYGSPGTAGITDRFLAVRDAVYFVEPPSVLERGRLWIGGRELTEPVFRLPAGEVEVRYEGPPTLFHLLWLPRDGRAWRPARLPPSLAAAAEALATVE